MATFHYGNHPRIPEIVALADEGWRVTTRGLEAVRSRLTRGAHGYPPELPSMQAIFLARGPAFKKGVTVPPFENVHLYALLAHLLGVTPATNDGSLDSVKAVLRSDLSHLLDPHTVAAPRDTSDSQTRPRIDSTYLRRACVA